MVGLFHENWSGTSLNETVEPQPQKFKIARKPVVHADRPAGLGRPRAQTLGPQPQPLGGPVRRVPVLTHNRSSSEETLYDSSEPQLDLKLDLPMLEPSGTLEIDLHQFSYLDR